MQRYGSILAASAVLALSCGAPGARAADTPVAGTLDLSRLTASGTGAAGADEVLTGGAPNGRAGTSVAFAGDLDHYGRPGYAVGAPLARGGGQVAIVHGSPAPTGSTDLGALGARGLLIRGPQANARAGAAVAAAGDVNGDGVDDVLVGAPRNTTTPSRRRGRRSPSRPASVAPATCPSTGGCGASTGSTPRRRAPSPTWAGTELRPASAARPPGMDRTSFLRHDL